ncbi:MAG TPA: hypothetical protein VFW83_09080 [Bryobacteraceae bacterium]|nr:hypothetical protein [Bryobacteraceae bacterium]
MTDQQILAIVLASVPAMLVVMIEILLNNARLGGLRSYVEARFGDMDRRFNEVDLRFAEAKEVWRAELHRVEEVIDARLRHLEER